MRTRLIHGLCVVGLFATCASAQRSGREFSECGTIVAPPFCALSLAIPGGGIWPLSDPGGFGPGDEVTVTGTTDWCVMIPECHAGMCVIVETIEPAHCV